MTIMGAIGIAGTVDAITGDSLVRSLLVMSFAGARILWETGLNTAYCANHSIEVSHGECESEVRNR